jgi:2-polyprenyl-3-methyl-5-hydroxy-6-metoxy-1,4-benzoquinol methylase
VINLRPGRTEDEQAQVHRVIPVRIYASDPMQEDRVKRAQALIAKYCPEDVVELGCGTGDISGPFSESGMVVGYDIQPNAIAMAKERFPKGTWLTGNLERMQPIPCGMLVLSEVLEHLWDPYGLVKRWSPKARFMLVSHPLDEDLGLMGDMSAGEHLWSYSRSDHEELFKGFTILESETFQMGSYTCVMSIGRRE